MGILGDLLGSALSGMSGQGQSGNLVGALLSTLASESGRSGSSPSDEPVSDQSPAAVSGGLGELVQRLQQGGLGDVVQSWIGSGANRSIGPDQLHQALGSDTVNRLTQQTGMSRGELLPMLAQLLPSIVDKLTPQGRVPDQGEVEDMQQNQTIET